MKDLELLLLEAKEEIKKVESEHELNEVKANYLGKKSALSEIMASMRTLSIEEKKELGQKTTLFRRSVEEEVEAKRQELHDKAVNERLQSEKIDVTMPGKKIKSGRLHPLTKTIREIEESNSAITIADMIDNLEAEMSYWND